MESQGPMLTGSESTAAERSRGGRILIADDQQHVIDAIQMLLKRDGHSSQAALSPEAALAALQGTSFDLIVMDLNYARDTNTGSEGLTLIERVRALDAHVPILVLTGWGTVDVAVEAMRRGAADFIQKPWSNAQLLERVQKLLAQGREQRRARQSEEFERAEAAKVQRKLIPLEFPRVDGLQIHGGSIPLRFVSGDYFQVMPLGDGEVAVSIADVAGKGVPGALLAASLRTAEESLVRQRLQPAELCQGLNVAISEVIPEDRFISYFCCQIRGRALSYSNAGHTPPWLIRADGSAIQLRDGGAVLGFFKEWVYEQKQVELQSGDRILLFTDGLTEAVSRNGQEFGEERLVATAVECRGQDARGIYDAVMAAASRHCDGGFTDDASLMVIAME